MRLRRAVHERRCCHYWARREYGDEPERHHGRQRLGSRHRASSRFHQARSARRPRRRGPGMGTARGELPGCEDDQRKKPESAQPPALNRRAIGLGKRAQIAYVESRWRSVRRSMRCGEPLVQHSATRAVWLHGRWRWSRGCARSRRSTRKGAIVVRKPGGEFVAPAPVSHFAPILPFTIMPLPRQKHRTLSPCRPRTDLSGKRVNHDACTQPRHASRPGPQGRRCDGGRSSRPQIGRPTLGARAPGASLRPRRHRLPLPARRRRDRDCSLRPRTWCAPTDRVARPAGGPRLVRGDAGPLSGGA